MLYVHRSERADTLVGALGGLLRQPLDPLEPELVAVPSRGVERWVSQRLAAVLGSRSGGRDGVCANVAFPFPGKLVERAVSAASGVEPDEDPWRPERAVWPLLAVVEEAQEEGWLSPLARHLAEDGGGRGRRFVTVRHVADLFDRYGVYRPGMVRAWAEGSDEGTSAESRWQAELWRRLRSRLGSASPAERLVEVCRLLEERPELSDLPARLSLFGLTRVAASYVQVLGALAGARDVHLYLLHPSPVLWAAVSGAAPGWPVRRAEDPTAALASSPLLDSWGRDAREMQLVLQGSRGGWADDHRPAEDPGPSLLGLLQADVRADRPPPGPPKAGGEDLRPLLEPDDASLQVHACHSRARQVEVLRDALLHLLADDPTLEPRDVIVMCPDIEVFAPLVEATFGAPEGPEEAVEEMPTLRVRLADRALRQTNPLLGLVSRLLELAVARLTASEVLDLAAQDPVRRRFALVDEDLVRLQEWVAESGVRWGLDGEHRTRFGLEALEANTWQSGLDRLSVGVAMADEGQRLLGGVVPLDDVGSGDIELVGRFCELVERVADALERLRGPQSLGDWLAAIGQSIDTLAEVAERESWQRDGLRRMLEEIAAEASLDGRMSDTVLELPDVMALLEDRLRGRPTRANFRTGHLTVCTLVPMRSVPHRVVCLLGLDDGSFPRVVERDGDDLTVALPEVGDRDPRSEDRQLLLDALMAAESHLVITYTGRDERTNLERPPAVPVGELLDLVDRTVRGPDGGPARGQVVRHHPLQAFDPRNFAPGVLRRDGPWSFDPVALGGAEALLGPRCPPPPFLPGLLAPQDDGIVDLSALSRFLRHPVRSFLRQRLGVRLGIEEEEVRDGLAVELGPLEEWAVGDRLLRALLDGDDLEACLGAERARGALPPGALGERVLEHLVPDVDALVAAAGVPGDAASLDVDVALTDGSRLVGTVAGLHGDLLRMVTYSRLAPHHRLQAWLGLVALTACRPERPFTALSVGRLRTKGQPGCCVSVATLGSLGGGTEERRARATGAVEILVDLYRRGMREPLPLYCRSSAAWAQAAPAKRHVVAGRQWVSTYGFAGEDADPEHVEVLGAKVPFERLLDERPRADEEGTGWDPDEETRFGRYARRLWGALLEREQVVDR